MLIKIHPTLTSKVLMHLGQMSHSDAVVIANNTFFVDRFERDDLAEETYIMIRTEETQAHANALLRKGLARPDDNEGVGG
ncbi:hypothetical protein [Lysinibacter sp. HNR]|uniref:hypothetical protein n=1 Tax=Lysinibacter sp. HNR TaxID=3031408 RepID=UPI00243604F9|nr:hypothetical protein [Lysinibacter sp. HNR]WGD36892.1 hypothetical protein FrondiHNR_10620 [Lysinibacter sp. HNR]